jgi:non-ribosomal peptide synthase protein (TIGR01720 family)
MDNLPPGDSVEAIAVIGMAGRFPGAKNIDEFWRNLENGVESITFFTDEELLAAGLEAELIADKNYVKARGVIEDVEMFDAAFFGFNRREAEIMDPQHRIFLEEAHKGLEHAGYNSQCYSGLIGVYAGAGANYYLLHNLLRDPHAFESVADLKASTGNREDHLSTRVSYKLNLRGPSLSVQTACSTSLVAVHLACQGLLNYQCDIALAGGISIGLPQKSGYMYYDGGINSPDGHCRPFDAEAGGTVSGSGVGVVVLKRLSDALADRDTVYALIKGTAINNDGSTKVGYAAPSIEGQAQVISMALGVAGVSPDTITYIEAHGTATPLGDPIEVSALKQAFRGKTERKQYCAIGAVKSNIGHLDAAAGVVGLIKTVLVLRHKQIPPSINYRKPNPRIDFGDSPFYVNDRLRPWRTGGAPRRAGVSSFGIGGTNAHVVLEEWLEQPRSADSKRPRMLMLSAKTQKVLDRMSRELGAHLTMSDEEPEDLAYTLQVGRERRPFRRVIVCCDKREAIAAIAEESPKAIMSLHEERKHRRVVFMFPGQGVQQVGMCEELYKKEEVFREELDSCAQMLIGQLGIDVRELIYAAKDSEEQARTELRQTRLTQPVVFAVEYAMARMWMRMGIQPAGMIGHSLGEYVCACLAGVMSLQEAIRLVVCRARLMQKVPEGAMLSVGMSEEEVRERLQEGLWLSSVNEVRHCVVGGEIQAISKMEEECRKAGIWNKRLETSHAFHTGMIEEIAGEYLAEVRRVKLKGPEISYLSNLSGKWITEGQAADPEYWVRQMRETVRFETGLGEVLKMEGAVLLEAGPGEHISGMVRRRLRRGDGHEVISTIEKRRSGDGGEVQRALGRMWLAGVDIDWDMYHRHERKRVGSPTYSFDRQVYWIEGKSGGGDRFKREAIEKWFYVPIWKQGIIGIREERPRAGDEAWLIIMDEDGIGETIGKRAKDEGIEVVTLGGKFLGLEEETDRYKQEIKRINDRGKRLTKVVNLRGIARDSTYEDAEDLFCGLLSFAKAAGEEIIRNGTNAIIDDHSLELLIVTNDMHNVSGLESLCPEKSVVLGPCRVIPQEYPNVTCRSVDISLAEPGARTSESAYQILDEIIYGGNDLVVSYRGRRRWVQAHEAIRLPLPDLRRSRLRERGVYLITGGLGGISLELAHYLARKVKAKLALLGRSTFPERSEWERWLDSDGNNEVKRKIRKLMEIEQAGGELLVLNADLASRPETQAAVWRINERFGTVNGVIHAAGVPGSGLIQFITRQKASSVLAPKVKGALVLDEIFRDSKIDFMVLCSSVSSILGRYGRVDYCGANAFLDAFAQSRSYRNGALIVSINWDGWSDVGMGVNAADLNGVDATGESVSPREGVEVFASALCADLAQLIVSVSDFNRRFERRVGERGWQSVRELESGRKSKATSARPDIGTDYVRPGTQAETTLAGIWQDLLGIAQVGIHDNFFELGGDSVVAIQVVLRANQEGLNLSAKHIFDHGTVAELAALAASSKPLETDHAVAVGPAPLTPIQCSFFEAAMADPHHFNQSAMLEVDRSVGPLAVAEIVTVVLARHDALWLRYDRDGEGWKQRIAGLDGSVQLQSVSLAHLSDIEQRDGITRGAVETQGSLNIKDGPIIRVVLFDFGKPKNYQLLIVIHHLAVDLSSWRILLEDMQTAYGKIIGGTPVKLSRKTSSFKTWAEKLNEFADNPAVKAELDYWNARLSVRRKPLPVDHSDGINTVASEETVFRVLDEEYVQPLLRDVVTTHHITTQEVLSAALAKVLAEWTGDAQVLVAFEGHGREPIFDGIDVSRTVGWFTTVYPAALGVEETGNSAELLRAVKEQLRGVPNHGIGYGLLRYLAGDSLASGQLSRLGQPEVSFLYSGYVDEWQKKDSTFKRSVEMDGPTRSPRQMRRYLLGVDVVANDGALQVSWRYSGNIYRRRTVEMLAEKYVAALKELIAFALSHSEAVLYAPSDFPEANLSQQELDDIVTELNDLSERT